MSARSILIPSALIAILVGCTNKQPTTDKTTNTSGAGAISASQPDNPNPDVGQALYPAGPAPLALSAGVPGNDPIAIPCTLQYEDRQQISAEADGKIDLIASPFTKVMVGDKTQWEFHIKDPSGGAEKVIVYDPEHPHPGIVFHPRDPNKERPFWKLVDGDRVSDGQMLCYLDDELWLVKKTAAEAILSSSKAALASAKDGTKYSQQKVDLDKKGMDSRAVPLGDLLSDLITLSRFVENEAQSLQSIAKAESDLSEAMVNLRKQQVTSRVEGIIRSIAKRPGEFVRAGEKIMEIQSTEKVRLEGNLDVQYFDRVKRHMEVSIEPAIPSAPVKSHAWHRAEVGGICVSGHAKRPLVISASMDNSVMLWDPNLDNETGGLSAAHTLPHPVGVRSVGCTPPGVTPILVITGAEDGRVRIWDITDPKKLPKTPLYEPADAHASGIQELAVSPDGKFAATAAGREVFIWDMKAGKKLYALSAEHRDTVTSVGFTPQTQLVTASKDGSVKVWKLGATTAAVTKTMEHRSMAVDTLGISPDGGRVLFDQDKSRIDLVTLTDAQTTGQITNVGPGISFANLAIFAPDRGGPDSPYTIVTAGGEGDLKGGLQVWQLARSGGRGNEIARLMTPGRVPVVCAAFSPHKDIRFLAVGTDRGTVHVWTPPSETQKKLEGRITNIEPSDPRFVTVRVEMTNKGLGLLDRGAATVIVNPTK